VATCSSCGAPITWALTLEGKRMPLDAHPNPAGMFFLATMRGPIGSTFIVAVARREDRLQGPRTYSSHFSTCPDAAEHRRT